MAMANYGKRHIIEVPMSRVKTNAEFEDILNATSIEGVHFSKNQVILLFDEIDREADAVAVTTTPEAPVVPVTRSLRDILDLASTEIDFPGTMKRASSEEPKKPKDSEDKLSFGTVLSRLDGIGNYNGVIIIGTTNNLDKIDPVLYRHGRLDPYKFTFSRREDIKAIIEHAYRCVLTEEQATGLPDRDAKITPSTLKKYIHDHRKSVSGLLEFLSKREV